VTTPNVTKSEQLTRNRARNESRIEYRKSLNGQTKTPVHRQLPELFMAVYGDNERRPINCAIVKETVELST
jgi:hypothetical protein